MTIGKEASNPDMTRKACLDTWHQAPSKQFAMADQALTACLNQLNLTATAGALLPQTMLYQASGQKQRRNNDNLFAAAKQLKITPHDTPNHGRPCKDSPPNDIPAGSPNNPSLNLPPPPQNDRRHNPRNDQHGCTGDIIYAAKGYMPMPKGHGRWFCAGFL